MSVEVPRARIFISCGQLKQTEEAQVAGAIRDRLRELGFDPYIAVAEQTLRGVKENIFEQLRQSEYFLFVDFKRELLVGTDPQFHRGSLFSHQELAIASFLDIDVLAFQEIGVKRTDGLLQFLQTNSIPFTDKHTLPSVVADVVRQRGWDSNWRNELILEPSLPVDTGAAKCFHVSVRNRHRSKPALNCFAYLESAIKRPNTNIALKTIEFKWAATIWPSVTITARSARLFDACHIAHANPYFVHFQVHTDSPREYAPQLPQEIGEYELSYLVTAENFSPARGKFILDLRNSLAETTLTSTKVST